MLFTDAFESLAAWTLRTGPSQPSQASRCDLSTDFFRSGSHSIKIMIGVPNELRRAERFHVVESPGAVNTDYYGGLYFYLPEGFWQDVNTNPDAPYGPYISAMYLNAQRGSEGFASTTASADLEFVADSNSTGHLESSVPVSGNLTEGSWHSLEIRMRLTDTPGVFGPDWYAAEVEYWVDAVQNGPYAGEWFAYEVDLWFEIGSQVGDVGFWDIADVGTYYADDAAFDTAPLGLLPGELVPDPDAVGPARYFDTLWRFVVADLNCAVITWLDHFFTARELLYTLNAPALAKGDVPSDNPEVNILHTDGDPFLSHNNRVLFGFRREQGGSTWEVRSSGIIHLNEDDAGSDAPVTHLTAWDPWMLLNNRPILTDSGLHPGRDGLGYFKTKGSDIAKALLVNTDVANGSCMIDYGQTAFYAGTLEDTAEITISFQQGMSVGEAWTALTDTATLDIVLTPIYDPINRPGFISELSIYAEVGEEKNEAVFAWDRPGRSLVGITRTNDGTQMGNKVLYYDEKAKPATVQTDATSVAKFGEYWMETFFTGQGAKNALNLLALAQLLVRRNGKKSIVVNPAPERSPLLFLEYFLGDRVSIYASNRLREELNAPAWDPALARRVFAIPVVLSDNGKETVRELLLAPPNE